MKIKNQELKQRQLLLEETDAKISQQKKELQLEIEERKKAEDALTESEDRFRSVVQTAGDAIINITRRKEMEGAEHDALVKSDILYHQLRQEHEIAANVFKNIINYDKLKLPNVRYYLSAMDTFCGDLVLSTSKPSGGFLRFAGILPGTAALRPLAAFPQ